MIYEIEPLDNYFFRGPAPFEAGGETTVSQSGLQPLPSAYSGAFGSLIKDKENHSRNIKIGYNGLMFGKTYYFPMPHDLYPKKHLMGDKWELHHKVLGGNHLSSYPFQYMLGTTNGPKEKTQPLLYLPEDVMGLYLQGKDQGLIGIDINDKITKETKLGIKIDYASGAAKNQQIYEISCIRPSMGSEWKLAVEVKADLLKESGVIKLGGEDKKAKFRQADSQLNIEKYESNSKFFKLYLATPAIFRKGWLPGWIEEQGMVGHYSYRGTEVTLQIVSGCIGRSIPCGGYGKVEGSNETLYQPREMRYAVPSGSVYYFELLEGEFKDAVKLFHGRCISDYRENLGFDYKVFNRSRYCDRGFGYSFVGTLNKEQEDTLNVQ